MYGTHFSGKSSFSPGDPSLILNSSFAHRSLCPGSRCPSIFGGRSLGACSLMNGRLSDRPQGSFPVSLRRLLRLGLERLSRPSRMSAVGFRGTRTLLYTTPETRQLTGGLLPVCRP